MYEVKYDGSGRWRMFRLVNAGWSAAKGNTFARLSELAEWIGGSLQVETGLEAHLVDYR